MTKKQFNPFQDLSAQDLKAALVLTAEALTLANKHQHSMSKLYGAHNALTGQTLPPERCATCLVERVAYLRKFVKDNEGKINEILGEIIEEQKAQKPATPPPAPEPPTGRVLTLVTEGEEPVKVMFDETGKNKQDEPTGVVSAETGKTLKPGKYAVDTGETLAVQPGGKATLKPLEDLT